MDDHRGQRSKICDIIGCGQKGRVLARLGGEIEIAYCPKHRKKYGERIINALINSCFNYKLTNFLSEVKTDIFFGSDILSEDSSIKLKQYILDKTGELEAVLQYSIDNEITIDEDEKV